MVQQPGIGFPLARVAVLLSLATGACHDLAIAPYAGKGTGETTLLRRMYDSLSPGDVVLADALFDNYFLACELRERGIELVARVQAERVGSRTVESRPDGDIILWQRPNKPRGMTGEQYRRYPKSLLMRQVTVDARDKDNRAEQFKVVTTMLDASIDGGQIGDLYERRWCWRGRHPLDQVGDADGRPAVQDAGDGAQGDLGPPAGVQPAPHGDGRGRGRDRHRAAAGELQGGQAGGDGVRPEDRGGAAGGSAGADRRAAGGDRLPPRRRPPGAVGAAGDEAPAEAGGPPEPTTSRGQAAGESLEMVLARGEAVGHFPLAASGPRRKELQRRRHCAERLSGGSEDASRGVS